MPKYKSKNGVSIAVLTNQQISIKKGEKNNKIKFPSKTNLKSLITKIDLTVSTIKQVRFIPKSTCFIVEIVYEKELIAKDSFDKNSFISLDLGLNNFVTAIDTKSNKPFIINGKGIKSVNQFYNKLKSNYQAKAKNSNNRYFTKRLNSLTFKRECKINDFMHKASDLIIKHCLEHKIANIIVGKNKEWKQEINLGKKTNLNFTSIPYQAFIEKLSYKSALNNINFTLTEESYTSKCDHLANEEMKHQENYLGKRVKRGLFKSSINKTLNADINGAIGIARKVFPNAVKTLRDSGTAFVPVKISINF